MENIKIAEKNLTAEISIKEYVNDIIYYRNLLFSFAWRDIIVRYKQTILGYFWSVIRPVLAIITLTFIFQRMGKFSSGGLPYPILCYTGILVWQYFSTCLTDSSTSLISNANMLSKVYFPRVIIIGSTLLVNLFDMTISIILFGVMLVYYKYLPSFDILFFPLWLSLLLIITLSISLLISSLTVKFRDLKHAIPFIVQFGMYITPVGYLSNAFPEKWKSLLYINPLVIMIDILRGLLTGNSENYPNYKCFIISGIVIIFLAYIGVKFFLRVEKELADII